MHAKTWHMSVFIEEDEIETHARAELATGDNLLTGLGVARRRRTDASVPEIGDELATARALADLAHQLLETTAADLEAVAHVETPLTS